MMEIGVADRNIVAKIHCRRLSIFLYLIYFIQSLYFADLTRNC